MVPGSPVPLITGWVVLTFVPAAGPVTVGATGGVVSIVNTAVAAGLVLPAASADVAASV